MMKVLFFSLLLTATRCHDHMTDGRDHFDHERGAIEAVVVNDNGLAIAVDWRKARIINKPIDQKSCGACWSFAVTGLLEAKYAQMTGELVKFSEGYLVDCQYPYSGCAGGHAADALEKLESTQFLPSAADYPFTGTYSGQCNEHPQDQSPDHKSHRNALKDVWLTFHSQLQPSERGLLQALQHGPIPIHYFISQDLGGYYHNGDEYTIHDEDIFEDKNCQHDLKSHSSLLVGFTDKAWIVKQSWGEHYGAHGYSYLARSDVAVQCDFFKEALNADMVPRREVEYRNMGGMYTFRQGVLRCGELNKPGKTGWTMAEIPTRMHLKQVLHLVQSKHGEEKKGRSGNKNYDNFWIGLNVKRRSNIIFWEDHYTQLAFAAFSNSPPGGDSTISMSRLNGKWSSLRRRTEMRIVCSRYVTCQRLKLKNTESIVFGADNAAMAESQGCKSDDAVETATATVTCKPGFTLHGDAEAVCRGGLWSVPECKA